jgi:glyoxylase I family protein
MVFEHFALNVNNVSAVVKWYVLHMELKVVSQQKELPFMTFLADSSDRVILELYQRSDEMMTNFVTQHPLTFHLAFVSENAQFDRERLEVERASFIEEVRKEDGSHLIMLRDPWGMPLQLCQRANKF